MKSSLTSTTVRSARWVAQELTSSLEWLFRRALPLKRRSSSIDAASIATPSTTRRPMRAPPEMLVTILVVVKVFRIRHMCARCVVLGAATSLIAHRPSIELVYKRYQSKLS